MPQDLLLTKRQNKKYKNKNKTDTGRRKEADNHSKLG